MDEWQEIRKELDGSSGTISYDLPSHRASPGAEHFREAFGELNTMLSGRDPVSMKRAVFLVENAFLDNSMDYAAFSRRISVEVAWCRAALTGFGLGEGLAARRYALERYFTDTLSLRGRRHLPLRYDFEDIRGERDYTKLFVSKLLATGSGQCHSLPLLYLILAEELDLPAYLAFSPGHSYIRFRDERGQWHNFETTNGNLVSDSWILASGYIKTEALRTGIYMDTTGRRGTVACCLVDLAKAYSIKYGMDRFVEVCTALALRYDPKNLHAWLLRSDYLTYRALHILRQTGDMPGPQLRRRYPKAWQAVQACKRIYAEVDAMGYTPMPKEEYQKWLNTGGRP